MSRFKLHAPVSTAGSLAKNAKRPAAHNEIDVNLLCLGCHQLHGLMHARQIIDDEHVGQRAAAFALPVNEVRAHYENLAIRLHQAELARA